mmetsp:Transcript_95113/g.273852  ORF Transcript_95113/g.273852 Transcript_95113/m.273852 type:complete len:493 (+) Transcript_95113:65-1543(+)
MSEPTPPANAPPPPRSSPAPQEFIQAADQFEANRAERLLRWMDVAEQRLSSEGFDCLEATLGNLVTRKRLGATAAAVFGGSVLHEISSILVQADFPEGFSEQLRWLEAFEDAVPPCMADDWHDILRELISRGGVGDFRSGASAIRTYPRMDLLSPPPGAPRRTTCLPAHMALRRVRYGPHTDNEDFSQVFDPNRARGWDGRRLQPPRPGSLAAQRVPAPKFPQRPVAAVRQGTARALRSQAVQRLKQAGREKLHARAAVPGELVEGAVPHLTCDWEAMPCDDENNEDHFADGKPAENGKAPGLSVEVPPQRKLAMNLIRRELPRRRTASPAKRGTAGGRGVRRGGEAAAPLGASSVGGDRICAPAPSEAVDPPEAAAPPQAAAPPASLAADGAKAASMPTAPPAKRSRPAGPATPMQRRLFQDRPTCDENDFAPCIICGRRRDDCMPWGNSSSRICGPCSTRAPCPDTWALASSCIRLGEEVFGSPSAPAVA